MDIVHRCGVLLKRAAMQEAPMQIRRGSASRIVKPATAKRGLIENQCLVEPWLAIRLATAAPTPGSRALARGINGPVRWCVAIGMAKRNPTAPPIKADQACSRVLGITPRQVASQTARATPSTPPTAAPAKRLADHKWGPGDRPRRAPRIEPPSAAAPAA